MKTQRKINHHPIEYWQEQMNHWQQSQLSQRQYCEKHHLGLSTFLVFINRRKTQMKILYFERTGYCIWSKRLEQGLFNSEPKKEDKVSINSTDLKMIIEGIKVKKIRQFKRYKNCWDFKYKIIKIKLRGFN